MRLRLAKPPTSMTRTERQPKKFAIFISGLVNSLAKLSNCRLAGNMAIRESGNPNELNHERKASKSGRKHESRRRCAGTCSVRTIAPATRSTCFLQGKTGKGRGRTPEGFLCRNPCWKEEG